MSYIDLVSCNSTWFKCDFKQVYERGKNIKKNVKMEFPSLYHILKLGYIIKMFQKMLT
jgi:hypothetical protein